MGKIKEFNKIKNEMLNSPCTITEATQIARGVAEDVVMDYQHTTRPLQVAMSLQIEILKETIIKSGLITEEEFKVKYIEKAEEFNKLQREAYEAATPPEESDTEISPKMSIGLVDDIDIKTER